MTAQAARQTLNRPGRSALASALVSEVWALIAAAYRNDGTGMYAVAVSLDTLLSSVDEQADEIADLMGAKEDAAETAGNKGQIVEEWMAAAREVSASVGVRFGTTKETKAKKGKKGKKGETETRDIAWEEDDADRWERSVIRVLDQQEDKQREIEYFVAEWVDAARAVSLVIDEDGYDAQDGDAFSWRDWAIKAIKHRAQAEDAAPVEAAAPAPAPAPAPSLASIIAAAPVPPPAPPATALPDLGEATGCPTTGMSAKDAVDWLATASREDAQDARENDGRGTVKGAADARLAVLTYGHRPGWALVTLSGRGKGPGTAQGEIAVCEDATVLLDALAIEEAVDNRKGVLKAVRERLALL